MERRGYLPQIDRVASPLANVVGLRPLRVGSVWDAPHGRSPGPSKEKNGRADATNPGTESRATDQPIGRGQARRRGWRGQPEPGQPDEGQEDGRQLAHGRNQDALQGEQGEKKRMLKRIAAETLKNKKQYIITANDVELPDLEDFENHVCIKLDGSKDAGKFFGEQYE